MVYMSYKCGYKDWGYNSIRLNSKGWAKVREWMLLKYTDDEIKEFFNNPYFTRGLERRAFGGIDCYGGELLQCGIGDVSGIEVAKDKYMEPPWQTVFFDITEIDFNVIYACVPKNSGPGIWHRGPTYIRDPYGNTIY